jgi:hypothetical protein
MFSAYSVLPYASYKDIKQVDIEIFGKNHLFKEKACIYFPVLSALSCVQAGRTIEIDTTSGPTRSLCIHVIDLIAMSGRPFNA